MGGKVRDTSKSEIAVFDTLKIAMINFHILSGFISVMKDIENQLQKGKVCFISGCYGTKTYFLFVAGLIKTLSPNRSRHEKIK